MEKITVADTPRHRAKLASYVRLLSYAAPLAGTAVPDAPARLAFGGSPDIARAAVAAFQLAFRGVPDTDDVETGALVAYAIADARLPSLMEREHGLSPVAGYEDGVDLLEAALEAYIMAPAREGLRNAAERPLDGALEWTAVRIAQWAVWNCVANEGEPSRYLDSALVAEYFEPEIEAHFGADAWRTQIGMAAINALIDRAFGLAVMRFAVADKAAAAFEQMRPSVKAALDLYERGYDFPAQLVPGWSGDVDALVDATRLAPCSLDEWLFELPGDGPGAGARIMHKAEPLGGLTPKAAAMLMGEFPQYPIESLPHGTPEGWTLFAWRNDAMPYFITDKGAAVFCDYPDRADRECQKGPRFLVQPGRVKPSGEHEFGDSPLLESDRFLSAAFDASRIESAVRGFIPLWPEQAVAAGVPGEAIEESPRPSTVWVCPAAAPRYFEQYGPGQFIATAGNMSERFETAEAAALWVSIYA